MTIPNLLTILRLLLIPVFVTQLYYGLFEWALATFFFAGVSDAVDGFIARRFNQSSELWLGLEDLVLEYAAVHQQRLTVLTGPVLHPDDPTYRGVQLPLRFWKIAAWATRDGRQGSGGEAVSTNQRMEIRAALEAVRALPGPLVVVSDSTYVVNCFRDGWWRGWLARGWTTSAKKPVANRDLWEPLVELVNERGDVSFRWVKGHSGDAMNDLVDALAVEQSHAVA